MLLQEMAAVAVETPNHVLELIGPGSHLLQRLEHQDRSSAALLEVERPGLYPKTWMAHLMGGIYVLLGEIAERPARLPDHLSDLEVMLHKVLIAAHDIYDPAHRSMLLAKAVCEGSAIAKNQRSQQSRDAVRARRDQKTRADFMDWASAAIAAGKAANTVDELQAMDGFKTSWSLGVKDPKTLRKWAREAGFVFKNGRPKKNKSPAAR